MRFIRNLLTRQEGSALPIIGIGMATVVGAVGTAVDMGRLHMVQSKLSQSLDAAGLAAGAAVSTTNVNDEVSKYMSLNFPSGTLGSTLTSLSATVSADSSTLSLSATATMQTSFLKVLGINTLTAKAASEIMRQAKGMELALVIDNTGSMEWSAGGGVTRIAAAKSAAKTLVNTLYGSKTTIDNLWIGLVPFAQAVNIGTGRSSWTTTPPGQIWKTSGTWGKWYGCVDARETNGMDITEDYPSTQDLKFPKYNWACNKNYDGYGNKINAWHGTNNNEDNCESGYGIGYRSLSRSLGPNKYCSEPITTLTNQKQPILDAIDDMVTDGNTHIVLGAAWGWRLLSEKWQDKWGGLMNTYHLPLNYNTPLMNKVMILMTDGDNTITNDVRGAYGYLNEGRLGTTSGGAAVDELDERLTKVCAAMKKPERNIIIYTVAFGTNISNSAKDMLKACASKDEFFFVSPDATTLQTAFKQIGDSLANLRISK